jgi:hypothetical protein
VRPVIIVVADVLGEHCCQVALADDEHSVQALPADGADPPLGDRVGPSCRMHPIALMGVDLSG